MSKQPFEIDIFLFSEVFVLSAFNNYVTKKYGE